MIKKTAWLFGKIWKAITFLRVFTANFFFIAIVLLIIGALAFKGMDTAVIENNSALVLSISGDVVEQKSYQDPFSNIGDENKEDLETKLSDILKVINKASFDNRIGHIVLDLKNMGGCGISKLQDIGKALKNFKRSGKKIYAIGDYYSQSQYYLAAHADKIIMNPYGQVMLTGLGSYRMFFASAINKLKINFHIFRVGKYKSAIEPIIRNNMSDEARKANYAYLTDLWGEYKKDVAKLRNISPAKIDYYINNLDRNLKIYDGDPAKMAKEMGLIDSLYTRDTIKGFLYRVTHTPGNEKSFRKVGFRTYLASIKRMKQVSDKPKVAVLVAKGAILDGKQYEGKIGGDSFSALIRKARKRKDVRAIVIRVDSGGGSAFASEIIRREVVMTKRQGIPVIVSMGSVAASGGYWMSANADEIWASPTTITGSIGIFGALPTFEKTLNYIGVNNDGVGTNKISGGFDTTRPLNPIIKSYIQQSVEKGYRDFLKIVSKGRKIPIKQVEWIAQGRVWSGKKAKTFGLVDKLGSLDQAIVSAAKIAKLKDYEVIEVERELTKTEKFFKSLKEAGLDLKIQRDSALSKITGIFEKEMAFVLDMNDPNHVYAKMIN